MPKHDIELLRKVSHDRGEDVSDFVRRAVYKELAGLGFLSAAKKKALGIKQFRPSVAAETSSGDILQ
jgi:hypothetical protein